MNPFLIPLPPVLGNLVNDVYCDYRNGSDAGGDGSINFPYKTVQHAFLNHGWATSGGHTVWVADTEAQVLTDRLNFTTTNTTLDNPMHIRVWARDGADGGGMTTVDTPLGVAPGAHFDINGNTSWNNNVGVDQGVYFTQCKFWNATGYLLTPSIQWSWTSCNFFGPGGNTIYMVSTSNGAEFFNCLFDPSANTTSAGRDVLYLSNYGKAIGCRFVNTQSPSPHEYAIRYAGSGSVIADCVIESGTKACLADAGAETPLIRHNSLIGTGSGNGEVGVETTTTTSESLTCENNIFYQLAKGIVNTAGNVLTNIGPNGFWDCPTKIDNTGLGPVVPRSGDIDEVADPFIDPANDNYQLRSDSLFVDASYWPARDFGAIPAENTGGGGAGPTQRSHSF